MLERTLDRMVFRFPYRYEVLLLLVFVVILAWPLFTGFQGFVMGVVIFLVLLDARSASQFKRGTEDLTTVDRYLSAIPFRYEILCALAAVLWGLWWLTAGTTGFMFGLGIFMLALRARSSSQLKRGTATTYVEVE